MAGSKGDKIHLFFAPIFLKHHFENRFDFD